MVDHPDWHPGPRSIAAGARCLAYLMAAVAGMDVLFGALGRTGLSVGHLSIDLIGGLASIAGTVAAFGTVFRRWEVEFIAVSALTVGLFAYTVLDWAVLLFVVGYPPVPMASLAIGAGAAVVAAVATGKKRWRWLAVASAIVILALAVPLQARGPAIMTALTSLLFARSMGLYVFADSAVRARRMRAEVPELDP